MSDNNFHLTYGDLKKFTNEELKQFRYCNLMLDKLRLVDEIKKQNIIVPDEVRDKIFNLCDAVDNPYPQKHKLNLVEVLDIIAALITISECVKNYLPEIQKILETLITYIQ